MFWQEAEAVACAWLRANGHPNATRTAPGADGGIDIEDTTIVAQVKAHTKPVGRPDIQKLSGVAKHLGRRPLFFSTSGYTLDAINWATGAHVALYTLDANTGTARPDNRIAHEHNPSNITANQRTFTLDPAQTTKDERKRFKRWAREQTNRMDTWANSDQLKVLFASLNINETVTAVAYMRRRGSSYAAAATSSRLLLATKKDITTVPYGAMYAVEFDGRKLRYVAGGDRYTYTIPDGASRERFRATLSASSM